MEEDNSRASGGGRLILLIVVGIIVLSVLFKCQSSLTGFFKKFSENLKDSKIEKEFDEVLNEIANNSKYAMTRATKDAGDAAAKAQSNLATCSNNLNQAIQNDPPWYLEFTDGILWWDNKREATTEYNKAQKAAEKTWNDYKAAVATDDILNSSKNAGNESLLDKILGALGFNTNKNKAVGNGGSGVNSSMDSIVRPFIYLLLFILFLTFLKRKFSEISNRFKRKFSEKDFNKQNTRSSNNNSKDEYNNVNLKDYDAMDTSDYVFWSKAECKKLGLNYKKELNKFDGDAKSLYMALIRFKNSQSN